MWTIYLSYTSQITFIGCPLNSNNKSWHTALSILVTTAQIDFDYLESLVNYRFLSLKTYCTYVGHKTARRPLCGILNIFSVHVVYMLTICKLQLAPRAGQSLKS